MSEYESREQRPQPEQIDLIAIMDFFWKGILRYWWLPIELALIVGAVFWVKGYRSYCPIYQTSAVYMVESNTEQYSSVYRDSTTTKQIVDSFSYILSSTSLREMVQQELGVSVLPASVNASSLAGTNMMTLTARGADPVAVFRTLNAVVDRFPDAAQHIVGAVTFKIVDIPVVPMKPYNASDEMSQARRGALIGAVAGLLLILLYAVTRNTILNTESIGKKISVECLGELPRVRFKKRGKAEIPKVLITESKVPYSFRESYRAIRTKLLNKSARLDAKVLLVTSTFQNEGKTITAFNLALSLANTGRSVILVDGDMRKSTLLDGFGMECGAYDLMDLLKGRTTIDSAAVRFEHSHLKVLSAKEPVANAAELMDSQEMADLIQKLREKADYVILDSPPVDMMTDALALANHADGIIYIVRYNYGRLSSVVKGIETMSFSEKPILGYIFNAVERNLVSSIYSYGNSGYGRYGYGKYGKYGKYSNYGKYGKYGYESDDVKEDVRG